MRFGAVAVCLAPFAPYPRGHTRALAISGLLLGVGHFGLLFLGMQFTDVGISSVINRFGGVLLAILGVAVLGEVVSIRLWAGLAISMAGVVVLVADSQQFGASLTSTTALGAVILLISSSSWSLATVYMKAALANVSTVGQLAWVAFYSVPGCLFCSWLFESDQLSALQSAPLAAWIGFSYTVIGSSLVAYGLWYELVKRCPVSRLSPFLFLMPIVGVAAGIVFRGEQLTVMRGFGTLLILFAMRLSL
jgi:O-acetylserine/cysteine efflux transporter